MAKRQRQRSSQRQGTDHDKPAYAADYAVEQPKTKGKQPETSQEAIHVQEHLQSDVAAKLNALKARLKSEEEASSAQQGQKPMSGTGANRKRGKTPKSAPTEADKREKSFAELFDPVEEEDASFADLLKDSKLDWRKYK